jgi:hypothetical protein
VRIIAALVNPVGPAPERETVTLINTSAHDLDLRGWTLLDRLKQRMPRDPITLPGGRRSASRSSPRCTWATKAVY